MKARYILFRRGEVYYSEDTTTGQQTSLRTKDHTEAQTLLHTKNEAVRQPMMTATATASRIINVIADKL